MARAVPFAMLVVAAVLLALPSVASHDINNRTAPGEGPLPEGTYLDHTELWQGSLAPGDWMEARLAFEGLPLKEGWWMLLGGHVAGGEMNATLLFDEEEPLPWHLAAGAPVRHVALLPVTEAPVLRLENQGNATVHFSLYHDVTCHCTSKVLRAGSGALWLDGSAERAGSHVQATVTVIPFLPDHHDHGGDSGPGNITVTAQRVQTVEGGLAPVGDVLHAAFGPHDEHRAMEFSFHAEAGGPQRFLFLLDHDGDDQWHFQVHTVWEEAGVVQDRVAPLWMAVAVLAALTAAFVALSRFRR